MELTAYDGNLWRVERLQKAARIVSAILGLSGEQLAALIAKMHDHKGDLVITWYHEHTKQQELAFLAAWRECGEYNVTHIVVGGAA